VQVLRRAAGPRGRKRVGFLSRP